MYAEKSTVLFMVKQQITENKRYNKELYDMIGVVLVTSFIKEQRIQ